VPRSLLFQYCSYPQYPPSCSATVPTPPPLIPLLLLPSDRGSTVKAAISDGNTTVTVPAWVVPDDGGEGVGGALAFRVPGTVQSESR
jgi:hypothetical protein